MRKIYEFATLCDVNACMIIYGPPKQQENSSSMDPPEIWPENPDDALRMINIYKGCSKDSATRIFSLSDFFHERKKRVEDEFEKLRKRNMEIQYPTWIDPMSHLSEMDLRKFAATLSNKLEVVNSRIGLMFKANDHNHNHNHIQQQHQMIDNSTNTTRLPGLVQRGIELELMNQQLINIPSPLINPIEMHVPPVIHYPPSTILDDQEHHHHHEVHSINQNSMMMLLMNENNDHHGRQVQFGGSASSIQCASFKYYESNAAGGVGGGGSGIGDGRGGGILENMVYNHPRPLARCYGSSVQPMVPCMQYPHLMMPNIAPQMHSSRENECNDITSIQYWIKDQKPPRH
ncbi:hypothetical protein ACH5RR_022619 [Cinchona calisaya]|uniref:MADS-box domain-containing protein n=1 Tax=Cinchona calisaya TaxID=153742 RepID=A0ABD2ZC80_9GENT